MCDYDVMCVREGEYMSENECLVCDGMCEIVCDGVRPSGHDGRVIGIYVCVWL